MVHLCILKINNSSILLVNFVFKKISHNKIRNYTMNTNTEESIFFKKMFMNFASKHNITVERYCSVKLLSFYNHNFDPVMLYDVGVDEVAPLVLKPFRGFKIKKLVNELTQYLSKCSNNYLDTFLDKDFFTSYIIYNTQSIFLNKDYTSVHDIAYYQLELINNKCSTNFLVNLHTKPVKATYYETPEDTVLDKYLVIDVYYKDIESLLNPFLDYYSTAICKMLEIPLTPINKELLTVLKMKTI